MDKPCQCPNCVYGKRVRDLVNRTENPDDKKLIEELYSLMFHAEDDRDYWRDRCLRVMGQVQKEKV